jgi:hypothetical protein
MDKPSFAHTRKALELYETSEYQRDSMLDHLKTNEDVLKWEQECLRAVRVVQIAFLKDTHHVNSWSHCKYASISWLKYLVTRYSD